VPKSLASRKQEQKKKQNPSRYRTYSFLVTIALILVIIGAAYYETLPTVGHIPDSFVFNSQEWMAYVPTDAEFVGYVNYKEVYSDTGNSSIFGTNVLISFPQLGFSIIPLDITYEVAIQLAEPQYSGSALVLQVSAWKQANLMQLLNAVNLTKIQRPLKYDGYAVYGLLTKELGDKNLGSGYLAVANNHIIFSTDKTSGLQNVEAVLDQVSSGRPSLFDDVTVRRGIYATGVTDQSCIAIFVGRFPTQLNDTEMVTKSVIGNGGSILVSRAFLFPSSDLALQRWSEAHTIYRDADTYSILDSWLVVTYNYPLSRLPVEIAGI
jgi:hypothetical protein